MAAAAAAAAAAAMMALRSASEAAHEDRLLAAAAGKDDRRRESGVLAGALPGRWMEARRPWRVSVPQPLSGGEGGGARSGVAKMRELRLNPARYGELLTAAAAAARLVAVGSDARLCTTGADGTGMDARMRGAGEGEEIGDAPPFRPMLRWS